MTMTSLARPRCAVAIAAALLAASTLAACGDGDAGADITSTATTLAPAPTGGAPATTAPDDRTESTMRPTTTAAPERPRRLAVLAVDDAGSGSNPVLSWAPVDGAVLYRVVVLDPDGDAYWAWSGTETSIPVGGSQTPTLVGARVFDDVSWHVSAHAADGTPLALSERQTLTP